MFGYLAASVGQLTEEELRRYKACYCGLCRSLRDRHGVAARMTLNYDLTFLVLLLDSLYEPDLDFGEEPCIAHPVKARQWQRSPGTDYAADLNTALAYLKCLDDWEDDGNALALAEAAALKSSYEKICFQYPRQCEAIQGSLKDLHELEISHVEDPDAAAACFGRLMAELFVWRDDRWSGTLRAFGDSLGRFLYVMDACMDLDADAALGRYNPFRRYYGLPDNEQRFRDILKMLLADCLKAFDRLPLIKDAGLMQNILCVGLWAQFNQKYLGKKENTDGSGSVSGSRRISKRDG